MTSLTKFPKQNLCPRHNLALDSVCSHPSCVNSSNFLLCQVCIISHLPSHASYLSTISNLFSGNLSKQLETYLNSQTKFLTDAYNEKLSKISEIYLSIESTITEKLLQSKRKLLDSLNPVKATEHQSDFLSLLKTFREQESTLSTSTLNFNELKELLLTYNDLQDLLPSSVKPLNPRLSSPVDLNCFSIFTDNFDSILQTLEQDLLPANDNPQEYHTPPRVKHFVSPVNKSRWSARSGKANESSFVSHHKKPSQDQGFYSASRFLARQSDNNEEAKPNIIDSDEMKLVYNKLDLEDLFRTIEENKNPGIKKLQIDLSSKNSGISDSSMARMVESLIPLTAIEALALNFSNGNNKLSDKGIKCLSFYTNQLKNLTSLTLYLSHGEHCYTEQGVKILIAAFSELPNLTSLTLDLEAIKFNDTSIKHMAKLLTETSRLTSLKLGFSHSKTITDKGLADIIISIAQNTSLTSLSLNFYQHSFTDNGVKIVTDNLRDKLRNLKSLSLYFADDNSKISNDGIVYFSSNITDLTMLTSLTLNFSGARITLSGLRFLGKAIKSLSQLQSLRLKFAQGYVADGIEALLDGVKGLFNLQVLDLNVASCKSKIMDEGALCLAGAVAELINLKELTLNVYSNGISDKGLRELVKAIFEIKSIKKLSLTLGGNNVSKELENFIRTCVGSMTGVSFNLKL